MVGRLDALGSALPAFIHNGSSVWAVSLKESRLREFYLPGYLVFSIETSSSSFTGFLFLAAGDLDVILPPSSLPVARRSWVSTVSLWISSVGRKWAE